MASASCKICNTAFEIKQSHQKYCSKKCARISIKYVPKPWDNSVRKCEYCQEPFIPTQPSQKLCTNMCGLLKQRKINEKNKKIPSERACELCKSIFLAIPYNKKYCSLKCRNATEKLLKDQKCENTITKVCNLGHFSSLECLNELDFEYWFKSNYSLFGIRKIHKIDRFFPDCIAELHDGTPIRIELEWHANNFHNHRHDSDCCDLIISFCSTAGVTHVDGIPVISIFYINGYKKVGEYNYNSKKLSKYFEKIIELCNKNVSKLIYS